MQVFNSLVRFVTKTIHHMKMRNLLFCFSNKIIVLRKSCHTDNLCQKAFNPP